MSLWTTVTSFLRSAPPDIYSPPLDALDYQALLDGEWLEANGLGGWASSTVCGAHTRSYHGLLVVAGADIGDRSVVISRLDERIRCHGATYELATRVFGGGTAAPEGYRLLRRFIRYPVPVWSFSLDGVVLERSVVALHGRNTVVVRYTLVDGAESCAMELRPFAAGRNIHSLLHRCDDLLSEYTTRTIANCAEFALKFSHFPLSARVVIPGARVRCEPDWYYNFEYPVERARGLASREDLLMLGVAELELHRGMPVDVVLTTEEQGSEHGAVLYQRELERRIDEARSSRVSTPVQRALAAATEQHLLHVSAGEKTLIAGYHWFGEWGRDAMIMLPGSLLTRGRFDEAREVLRRFSRLMKDGLLPNLIGSDGTALYNTVDASLWFAVAVARYVEASGDTAGATKEFLTPILQIAERYRAGTHFGIRAADDGLVRAGEPEVQLTWMDAKIGRWVVTPRHGKAVEINSLWYKLQRIAADLLRLAGRTQEAERFERDAERIAQSFEQSFWNPELQCLYDCVADDGTKDGSIRPNQVFAISNPYPVITGDRALAVLASIERELLTPYGLRTLSRDHPNYQGRYRGDQLSRDASYHQGTVWPWLLGAYIDALVALRGAEGKGKARRIIESLLPTLNEAGIGTISEVFDGEAPHTAGGAIAQGWSVAEILRVTVQHGLA